MVNSARKVYTCYFIIFLITCQFSFLHANSSNNGLRNIFLSFQKLRKPLPFILTIKAFTTAASIASSGVVPKTSKPYSHRIHVDEFKHIPFYSYFTLPSRMMCINYHTIKNIQPMLNIAAIYGYLF